MAAIGTLYGVGVGPGDPELLTLKAVRIIQAAPVVAYPAPAGGRSQARDSAAQWLTGQREVPIPVVCQADREPVNRVYDEAAVLLGEVLNAGQDVALLCEGDPLFYGSFTYLFQRLAERFPCVVVPGVNSVSAAAAVAGRPLVIGSERIAIVPATAGDEALRQALAEYDSIAIMKPGRQQARILTLLRETQRIDDAVYVEQATRREQRIVLRVAELNTTPGCYFSMFLITRQRA